MGRNKNGKANPQADYEACIAAIQVGQLDQALALLQPYLAAGRDAEALRLLALIEVRQNRPDKAVVTLKQALGLERNGLILANLANALVYAGDLQAAEAVCRESLKLDEIPEVYNTLGSLLAVRKAYTEAIQQFKRALALYPDYTQARCNLANAHILSGNIECAFKDCLQLMSLDAASRQSYEDTLINVVGREEFLRQCSDEVLNIFKELAFIVLPTRLWSAWATPLLAVSQAAALQYEARIRCAIGCWLQQERKFFSRALTRAAVLREHGIRSSKGMRSLAAYEHYLRVLGDVPPVKVDGEFVQAWVLGDSHVLSWQGQTVGIANQFYCLRAELIMGAKAFHVAANQPNRYLWRLQRMLAQIPDTAPLVFSFGEIDCRLDEGILPFVQKSGRRLSEVVSQQTQAYAKAIRQLVPAACPAAWVVGVPAPNLPSIRNRFPAKGDTEFAQLVELIRLWNLTLAKACQDEALGFIDVYMLTVGEDGGSNLHWHCDGVHLQPAALGAAAWIPPMLAETAEALNAQGGGIKGV